jgi:hypothetical protein
MRGHQRGLKSVRSVITVSASLDLLATASGTSALLSCTYPAAGEYTIHVFAV